MVQEDEWARGGICAGSAQQRGAVPERLPGEEDGAFRRRLQLPEAILRSQRARGYDGRPKRQTDVASADAPPSVPEDDEKVL